MAKKAVGMIIPTYTVPDSEELDKEMSALQEKFKSSTPKAYLYRSLMWADKEEEYPFST